VKTESRYRFSLQWGVDTAEKIQAGDFINSLGNRKSEFLIMAVTEYIAAHPEIKSCVQKPKASKPIIAFEELEKMVRAIIAENMANIAPPIIKKEDTAAVPVTDEADVAVMLDNLDVFLS